MVIQDPKVPRIECNTPQKTPTPWRGSPPGESREKRPFLARKCANFRVGFAGLCCGIPGPRQLRSVIHVPQETSRPVSVTLLQPFSRRSTRPPRAKICLTSARVDHQASALAAAALGSDTLIFGFKQATGDDFMPREEHLMAREVDLSKSVF